MTDKHKTGRRNSPWSVTALCFNSFTLLAAKDIKFVVPRKKKKEEDDEEKEKEAEPVIFQM